MLDRMIGVGIAAHEGQLFGIANQLLGLVTALGLIAICVSAVVMWWRRRLGGAFGVPAPRVEGFTIERCHGAHRECSRFSFRYSALRCWCSGALRE